MEQMPPLPAVRRALLCAHVLLFLGEALGFLTLSCCLSVCRCAGAQAPWWFHRRAEAPLQMTAFALAAGAMCLGI